MKTNQKPVIKVIKRPIKYWNKNQLTNILKKKIER